MDAALLAGEALDGLKSATRNQPPGGRLGRGGAKEALDEPRADQPWRS
jgi:hypothetical protein